jgi:type I restriction enzyme S subunit
LPYEKVGKNEPVCIADEVPFDIPENWEWVRLGTISTYAETKKKINAQDADPNLWGLDLEDIEKGGQLISQKTVGERKAVGDKTIFRCGDILYSKLRPYLLKILVAPNNGICTPEIVPFNLYGKVNAYYIVEFLKSPYVDQVINSVTYGVKMPRVGTETMTSLLVPLPPISEQARIVARLKCVLPAVQSYNTAYEKGGKLTTEFPIQLKKSILQYAVQGELVPQDPADEPASVLLEHIRAEKEQLIKAGKIKRDKHESVIFRRDNSYYEISGKNEVCIDDQIPFDVPESWEWTRTGSLFQVNPRNRLPDDLDAGFMPMPLLSDGFGNHHDFQIRKWKEIKTGFTHFADGDIVIAKITPCFQNRKSAVISGLPNGVGAGTTELHVLRDHTKKLFMPYCLLIYKTHAFIEKGMKNFSGTAGQQRIGKELISDYLIPIPPLEEQKRIVSAVESIFKKLDDLLD